MTDSGPGRHADTVPERGTRRPMTLWLDVEDLFHYALGNHRPTGIQRLSFEIYAELQALMGDRVRFCRHDPLNRTLRTVPWSAVRAVFSRLNRPMPRATGPHGAPSPTIPGRLTLRRWAGYLPLSLRLPLAQAFAAQVSTLSSQVAVFRHGYRALTALPSLFRRPREAAFPADDRAARRHAPTGDDIRDVARPGDVLAALGAPWFHPDYPGFIGRVIKGRGIRTALLVHDLVPIVHPEWCRPGLSRVFGEWFARTLPMMDHVVTASAASAREIEGWSERTGTRLARPVRVLPVGAGFSTMEPGGGTAVPPGLPEPGYVLLVSTIEARKNHHLAFRLWQRLLACLPPEQVPPIVFAGGAGWLTGDLMQQIANCGHLGGKIVVYADPTDEELAALYRGCRFTFFPSFHEGFGLPVSESLKFGKPCIASDRAAIREAGQDFCLYFDPEDTRAAFDLVRAACTDDALIAEWEARIVREFRPPSWRGTAEALVSAVTAHRVVESTG